jgi:3-oxoacyl-[acyl-carrier-protein] synthase-3
MMAHITGCGTHLPGEAIDNAMLGARFGIDADWIDLFLGNWARHLTTDIETGETFETLADLATLAGRRALQDAGLPAADIEFLILATATPDDLMPATVNIVAERLERAGIATFQIQSGCTGALQALQLGRALIRSGDFRRGLVIGADNTAKFISPDLDVTGLRRSELVNYAMFGDGAGAVVLDIEARGCAWRLVHAFSEVTPHGRPPGQRVRWRGERADSEPLLMEDYKAIESAVPDISCRMLAEMQAHPACGNIAPDWFLPPQLSARMTDRLIATMGLPPAKCLNCVGWSGNNGNALPFFQLAQLRPRMQPGQRALGMAVESSKWLRAGFLLQAQAA